MATPYEKRLQQQEQQDVLSQQETAAYQRPAAAAPAPAQPAAQQQPYTPYRPPAPVTTAAPSSMPGGGWASWKDVPAGEQNTLAGMIDIWEQSIGYQIPITQAEMLEMVNGGVKTLHDIGQFMYEQMGGATNLRAVGGGSPNPLDAMPWAQYGLDKDTYAAMAGTYGTEYKKITGQDISKDALAKAFLSPPAAGGGIMTASQYAQQLMNDQEIQKSFQWVRFGLDYASWTQTKLSMRTAMGRDITDAEAGAVLTYNKAASGSNQSATVRAAGQQAQQQTVGVGGSVVR